MISEAIVREYLSEQLDVPVLMELPEAPSERFHKTPRRFVVLEKVGGGMADYIYRASIAVQSYSLISLYDAAELDDAVKAAMLGIVARPEISGVQLASNYNHTDTRSKRYRYQSVFEINY